MVRNGRGISIRFVLLLGLAATAVAYLGLRIWTGPGRSLPEASWSAAIVLVFMACGVAFAALPIRRFLRGKARKPLNPLRAMRTLVLAQAAALTGAVVTGWYLAQILVLLPLFDVSSRRAVVLRLTVLAACGVLMVVAGLWAQAMCRVDRGDEGNNGDDQNDRYDNYDNHSSS